MSGHYPLSNIDNRSLDVAHHRASAPQASSCGLLRERSYIGEPDRSRAADDKDYEVRYLAEKHDLSVDQVRSLIARFGNDREKIEAAVRQLNS